ncbi:MAG: hypothetical protein AAFU49_07425 [Pseudomonadota bacterium]
MTDSFDFTDRRAPTDQPDDTAVDILDLVLAIGTANRATDGLLETGGTDITDAVVDISEISTLFDAILG